jgi:hypothetical protein
VNSGKLKERDHLRVLGIDGRIHITIYNSHNVSVRLHPFFPKRSVVEKYIIAKNALMIILKWIFKEQDVRVIQDRVYWRG